MHEAEYLRDTPIQHRRDYGQFFTPPLVSRLMVQWVLKAEPESILDPAFGLGAFYDEVIRNNPAKKVQFVGYEIDKNIINYFNNGSGKENLKLNNCDYLETKSAAFDGIICNPPYMRFQKFLKRHDVLPKIEKQIGKTLIGYSNISSVFLVKALSELNDNGNLAFIMPFEFFNTGYGAEIKKNLVGNRLLKQIIIFSNEKEIFPEVTTTICVLLCKNDGKEEPIKITQVNSADDIAQTTDIGNLYQKQIEPSELPFGKKWNPILLSLFTGKIATDGFVRLSAHGAFKRGIATGANKFFALTKTKIEKLKLSDADICECITKSSQIRKLVFTEDEFNRLYDSDKPVCCLNVTSGGSTRARDYIKEGEKLGYHKRYLTKMRSPWYRVEHRQPAPILFGVFNRGRLKVVRNLTTAVNFTCFHSFYPNMFSEHLINKIFIYFLSDLGQEVIKANKRTYGDNLDKFEPGDLNDCLCPNRNQFEMIDDKEAVKTVKIAESDEKLAIQMSNSLMQRITDTKHGVSPNAGERRCGGI